MNFFFLNWFIFPLVFQSLYTIDSVAYTCMHPILSHRWTNGLNPMTFYSSCKFSPSRKPALKLILNFIFGIMGSEGNWVSAEDYMVLVWKRSEFWVSAVSKILNKKFYTSLNSRENERPFNEKPVNNIVVYKASIFLMQVQILSYDFLKKQNWPYSKLYIEK